jgi:cell division protease FtsH
MVEQPSEGQQPESQSGAADGTGTTGPEAARQGEAEPTAPSPPPSTWPPPPPLSTQAPGQEALAPLSYVTEWRPPEGSPSGRSDLGAGSYPVSSPMDGPGQPTVPAPGHMAGLPVPLEHPLPIDAVIAAAAQGQPAAPPPSAGGYEGGWGGTDGSGSGNGNGFDGTGGFYGNDEPPLEIVPRWETRKPRPFWERSRLLILIAGVWGVLFWYAVSSDPLLTIRDGLIQTWNAKWWLTALFAAELVRQVHYAISEHWGRWNHFWLDSFFGTLSHRTGRLNDWNRYRAKRLLWILVFIAVVAIIAGAAQSESPVQGLFSLPGQLVSALGLIAYVLFFMVIAVGQFVAIFWFLSKGGVETYMPDDVKTRFSHVWGQDAVLERVKESLVFLEDPESIESKGGYVPGGMLLWGPPGTGKTLMAEAVAGETGKPFVFVEPSAFINMFLGIGPLKVKSMFRKLRKLSMRYGGVIAFFDEADSLGNRGGSATGGIFGPGGVQGAAWPWSNSDCHGGSYLSASSLSVLLDKSEGHDGNTSPEGRRRVRDRMFMGGMGGGGGSPGTLQALLAEMSGLSKPRGFTNRVIRRVLGMKPKPPPKFRIMIMMATNRPDSLDEALLRPGRIDRIYKVGYPSKAGRIRTYKGYFDKVKHELSAEDLDKLATITPYGTGATIKDLVNESLIVSLRHGHEAITWSDVLEAKRLKELGPPEDVEYVERERHAVAVHEACHAVVAFRVRKHLEIDLATIEKGGTYLGMVSSIKPEDRFTSWRSEFEADVMVSLASLAGERYFFGGDSSSGVSGDLESATTIAGLMESRWGMGSTIASHAAQRRFGGGWPPQDDSGNFLRGDMGRRVEERLAELLERTEELVKGHKGEVFAVAHALETHKTLSGEDVEAVIEGKGGRGVDGRVYKVERFMEVYGEYHERLLDAHLRRSQVALPLPKPADWAPELALAAASVGALDDGVGAGAASSAGDGWPPPVVI